ncbi:acyl-CoA thioesterase [Neisseria animaloris]|uniref:Acyl-ACP thioesterase n=1 Tax=Neisseria animaloris TaxID=326522 RepID=A0A3S5F6D8_9NEIS|nr:thioesterase family protein [Neisseria animaloris]VEJ20389.1 Acyl-ACP thioesterase [Neisseria animaloris]
MARISIPLPSPVAYRTTLSVQIGDLNYGNHLANDAVLRLCHECRVRWLAQHAFTELDAGGTGLIMADAAVQYLAQARHGDVIEIEMGVADVGRSSFTLVYHLHRPADNQTIAKVGTGMVCFDYATQKVGRMPQALREVLEAV